MEGRRKGRKKEMREKVGGERKETGMDRRREKQMKEDERASVGGWMEKGKEEAGARKKDMRKVRRGSGQ